MRFKRKIFIFLILFIGLGVLFQVNSSYAQDCNSDAECDLCAGEVCFRGSCEQGPPDPCRRDCAICVQEGDQITCEANDTYCEGLGGECITGVCDLNSDYLNNPSGCHFSHVDGPAMCSSCESCGNGICEPAAGEDPESCAVDCFNPEFENDDEELPRDFCGFGDLAPPFNFFECEDGNVCTDDICNLEDESLGSRCLYEPKSCSGDTKDRCCPAACSGDSDSPNFDIDCCSPPPPPPPPSGGETPDSTPTPGAPGTDTPSTPAPVFIQGSGCALVPFPGHSSLPWVFGAGLMGLFWAVSRNPNSRK